MHTLPEEVGNAPLAWHGHVRVHARIQVRGPLSQPAAGPLRGLGGEEDVGEQPGPAEVSQRVARPGPWMGEAGHCPDVGRHAQSKGEVLGGAAVHRDGEAGLEARPYRGEGGLGKLIVRPAIGLGSGYLGAVPLRECQQLRIDAGGGDGEGGGGWGEHEGKGGGQRRASAPAPPSDTDSVGMEPAQRESAACASARPPGGGMGVKVQREEEDGRGRPPAAAKAPASAAALGRHSLRQTTTGTFDLVGEGEPGENTPPHKKYHDLGCISYVRRMDIHVGNRCIHTVRSMCVCYVLKVKYIMTYDDVHNMQTLPTPTLSSYSARRSARIVSVHGQRPPKTSLLCSIKRRHAAPRSFLVHTGPANAAAAAAGQAMAPSHARAHGACVLRRRLGGASRVPGAGIRRGRARRRRRRRRRRAPGPRVRPLIGGGGGSAGAGAGAGAGGLRSQHDPGSRLHPHPDPDPSSIEGWQPRPPPHLDADGQKCSWRQCFLKPGAANAPSFVKSRPECNAYCRESPGELGTPPLAPSVEGSWVPDVEIVRRMFLKGTDGNGNAFPPPLDDELCEPIGTQGGKVDTNKQMIDSVNVRIADGGGGATRVLCMCYTMADAHPTRIRAMRETWAGRCDGFLAFSTESDPRLPAISIPHDGEEAYGNMWQKIRSIWRFVGEHYVDQFDYFFLGGDDMFVIPENLRAYLATLGSPDEDHFAGRRFKGGGRNNYFNSGGAGYAISRGLLRRYLAVLDDPGCSPNAKTSMEDVKTASCLRDVLGVGLTDTRDGEGRERFHPFSPGAHISFKLGKDPNLKWYEKYNEEWGLKTGTDCCAPDSVSFHYLKKAPMVRHVYKLLYDFRACGRSM